MADSSSGYRRIPLKGNVNQVISWVYPISPLALPQILYPDRWGVQAIDHTFSGSPFAMASLTGFPVSFLQIYSYSVMGPQDMLSWDMEAFEQVASYQVQIDDDSTFMSCEVNDTISITHNPAKPALVDYKFSVFLNELPDFGNLSTNTVYYWRMKPNYSFTTPTIFSKDFRDFLFN